MPEDPGVLRVFEDGDAQGGLELGALGPAERAASARLAVLDLTEYYGPDSGGVRTYLHEKARYVSRHDDLRQSIILPDRRGRYATAAGVSLYRVPSPRIPFQKTYRLLTNRRIVTAIARREQPSVIEVGSAYGVPWLATRLARELGLPVVWFYHAHLPAIVDRGPAAGVARMLAGRYVRAIARRVDRVLVGSQPVADDLARLGIRNTSVTPLGVDADHFHPRRRSARAATLRRLALPDGPLVLYTGRFTAEKAIDPVVEAWTRLQDRDATLLLAGAGPREGALAALAGPRVRLLPFVHDRELLADLYAAADLYLAPGPAETFGLSAHEAMASGTPVVSVDRGAVAAAVRAAGCGATYPLGDMAALDQGVRTCLDQRERLGMAGRLRIERDHRWETVFDRIFALYGSLTAHAGPGA